MDIMFINTLVRFCMSANNLKNRLSLNPSIKHVINYDVFARQGDEG